MKLININPKTLNLNPKRLFRSKKERSAISLSDPPSFGSGTSSSSTENGGATPTSVLQEAAAGDWSDHMLCELVQAFRLIDRDNDGVVSRAELEKVLTRLMGAAPPEVVAEMLGDVVYDSDGGGGGISVEALANRVGSGLEPGCNPAELREAFEVFDEDGDGRISAEELLRVFEAIGDERCTLEECRRMIEGVDRNGDGFVCFEDFSRMMEQQR